MQCQRAIRGVGLLAGRLLLAGDGTARSLAGAGVGLGGLAAYGQATAVPQATVAADVHEALDVELHLAAQVALDFVLGFHDAAEPDDLGFGEVLDPGIRVDLGLGHDDPCTVDAYSVYVRQCMFDSLVAWKVHSGDSCHSLIPASACASC